MLPLTPLTPRRLRLHEITLLAAMYWPFDEIGNAVDICKLESDFRTHAHNTKDEDSRGLWQINVLAHPDYATWNLFDPQVNAYCAYQIWAANRSWRPWLNAARKLKLLP